MKTADLMAMMNLASLSLISQKHIRSTVDDGIPSCLNKKAIRSLPCFSLWEDKTSTRHEAKLLFIRFTIKLIPLKALKSILPESSSSIVREGDASSAVFPAVAFLVTVLGTILQIEYQIKNVSPFDTHFTAMVAFIVIIFIYISTLVAEKILSANQINSTILGSISLISGTLAPVLLTLIIVPSFGWFAFIIWALFFAKVARDSFHQLYQLFYQAVLHIQEVLATLINGNAIEQLIVELPV